MLVITAPSKTQECTPRDECSFTQPLFLEESCKVMDILRKLSLDELCALMKMSQRLGAITRKRIEAFRPPLTTDNSCQAILSFQGDVYTAVTAASYTEAQLNHAQQHLRILSALYGVLRPLDLMFPYRLEMGTQIKVATHKNLYSFWGRLITDHLNEACSGQSDPTLVNLASTEYSRAVCKKRLRPPILTIAFKEKAIGSYRTVPVHAKRARGMMIDFMIRNRLTESGDLKAFTDGGYVFAPELSTAEQWVFYRS